MKTLLLTAALLSSCGPVWADHGCHVHDTSDAVLGCLLEVYGGSCYLPDSDGAQWWFFGPREGNAELHHSGGGCAWYIGDCEVQLCGGEGFPGRVSCSVPEDTCPLP